MTYDDFDFCKPYLVNGEYILWKGKPDKGNILTSHDIFLIPFSIIWCGFAIFWEITAILSGAPFFFAIFGIPFVFVGLYLVFGRFIWANYIRKRTAYVITNKKIIRLRGKKIDILDSKNMPPMYVDIHKNGNGTIRFGEENMYYRRRTTFISSNTGLFALENIPNAVQVQQIILSMEN